MKKYIKMTYCLAYSLIRFYLIKIFRYENFKFTFFNFVSPNTEIEISKKAKLSLGKMIRINSGSKIKLRNCAEVIIGANTFFNYGCMVISHDRVIIGEDVQFGPNVLIYDHDHDFRTNNGMKDRKYKTSPIEIGNNVWIGANTVILQGTKVGDNCIVGAGSLIKGEFPKNSIIKQIRNTEIVVWQED